MDIEELALVTGLSAATTPFRIAGFAVKLRSPDVMTIRYHLVDKWFAAGLLVLVGIAGLMLEVPCSTPVTTIVGIACIVAGAAIILFVKNVKVCTLDKAQGVAVFEEKGFTGHRVVQRPLDQVDLVETTDDKIVDRHAGVAVLGYRFSVYYIYLRLGSGEYRRVSPYYLNLENLDRDMEKIKHFLKPEG